MGIISQLNSYKNLAHQINFTTYESLSSLYPWNWISSHQVILLDLNMTLYNYWVSPQFWSLHSPYPLLNPSKYWTLTSFFKFILVFIFITLTLNIYKLGSPPSYSANFGLFFIHFGFQTSCFGHNIFIFKNILFSIFIFILLLFLKIFYFYLYSILIFLFLFHFSYFYFSYFISLQIRT